MKNNYSLAVAIAALFSGASFAAEPDNNAPVKAEPALTAEEQAVIESLSQMHGYQLGSFKAQPQLSMFYGYDDNIFASHDNERSDNIYGISGAVDINSDWEQHKLEFNLGFESGRYDTYDDEDYDDYWLSTEGRYDFNDNTNVFGGVSFSEEHEERGSPDDQFGKEPTTYTSTQLHGGVSHQWDQFSLRIGSTYEDLDFDDVDRAGGLPALNNDDRDRELYGLGARISYKVSPRYQPFAQIVLDQRDYDDQFDDNGYERDSDGYRASVGATVRLTNAVSGEGYIGLLSQDFDDNRFDDVDEMDFGGNLKWQVSPYTTINAYVKRSLEETTLAGSSSYLATTVGGNVKHRIGSRSIITAHLALGEEDYQDISREDDILDGGISYRYFLTKNLYLDTSYRIIGRDSSEDRLGDVLGNAVNAANRQDYEDYYSNEIYINLGMLLYPAPDNPWPPISIITPEFASVSWSGLYVGGHIGLGGLHAEVDGTRGSGIDIGEYGDTGATYGGFVGYGFRRNSWYLGLEGVYEDSDTEIDHFKTKNDAQTIEISKNESYGGALRLGYVVPTGSLIYGRLGMVETNFDTYNIVNDPLSRPGYDDDDSETGARYGVGVDIPANEHLFVRLDYSYTDYDDYTVNYTDNQYNPTTADYDIDETLFRLGVGYHFGKQYETYKRANIDRDGVYAGIQLGHGSINSDINGIHNDSGGRSNFGEGFADSAGMNIGGFLGYGFTYNKWFFALEGEADTSDADWDHIREPNGRNFSVDKKGSYGLNLRAGYTLDNGALLYGRIGAVKSRFNTEYTKGNNRDNDVERDDNVWGDRYGIGAEIPVTDHTFVRFDYTWTDYNAYDFTTAHGNSDYMEFDNDEQLFRVGIGVTF